MKDFIRRFLRKFGCDCGGQGYVTGNSEIECENCFKKNNRSDSARKDFGYLKNYAKILWAIQEKSQQSKKKPTSRDQATLPEGIEKPFCLSCDQNFPADYALTDSNETIFCCENCWRAQKDRNSKFISVGLANFFVFCELTGL